MRGTLEWRELLRSMGGALTTVGFIPQVWRLFRLKGAREISLPFKAFFVAHRCMSPRYLIAIALAMRRWGFNRFAANGLALPVQLGRVKFPGNSVVGNREQRVPD